MNKVAVKVTEWGDEVEFPLIGSRSDGHSIFCASAEHHTIYHIHLRPFKKVEMRRTQIGSTTNEVLVRCHCECGLTFVVPPYGMDEIDLARHFLQKTHE